MPIISARNPFELGECGWVERLYRHVRFRDSRSRLDSAPAPDSRQRQMIEELKRDGTLVLEGFIPPTTLRIMQDEVQDALEKLRFEAPCLAQARLDPQRHARLIANNLYASDEELIRLGIAFDRTESRTLDQVLRDFSPSTLTVPMLQYSEAFRRVWLDPCLLTIVAHYLGLVPRLIEAYVRRNFPARFRIMNHFWHRDLNDRHQLLKAFVFLSDCTLDNGPHEFVRGSHSDYSKLNGKRYYDDEEVDGAYPPGSRERLVSEVSAGTVILEDTRGLHRARMPYTGYRDLGYAVFVPLPATARPAYFVFPQSDYARLTAFQQAFIAPSTLR